MIETQATIKNSAGIHCRPSAVIIQALSDVDSVITVSAPSGSCEIGSTLDLLMLGLEPGTGITLKAEGSDEETAVIVFKDLFETEFDFPNAGE